MRLRARLLLFAAMLLGSALFYQPVEYDNTKSRYLLLTAMVDEGRFVIDSGQSEIVDKSFWNGHYYSNKAIGLPFLAAPVYFGLRRSGAVKPVLYDPAADYLVRVATVSLPFALTGLLLIELALSLGAAPRAAAWMAISYAFGTIAFNHAVLFSGHDTSAFFLLASFFLLYRGAGPGIWLAAGLCAGWAVLCDHFAAFGAVVLAWYALSSRRSIGVKSAFAGGAASCGGLLAIYNHVCFGSFWNLAYAQNDFTGFSHGASTGLLGIGGPRPYAAMELLVSVSRGLFFISPVLIFSLAGLAALRARKAIRRELIVIAAVPLLNFLANAGFYGWDGGWTFGPRYLVPSLPFLVLPIAFACGGREFFTALTLSVVQVGAAQLGWPHVEPQCANPIFEMIMPLMKEGGAALTLLPGAVQYAAIGFICAIALLSLPRGKEAKLPTAWKTAALALCGWIVFGLATTRSPDEKDVAYHRALLLNDAAWATGRHDLGDAADREFVLAGRPRGR